LGSAKNRDRCLADDQDDRNIEGMELDSVFVFLSSIFLSFNARFVPPAGGAHAKR
jgi:hypothetical protein